MDISLRCPIKADQPLGIEVLKDIVSAELFAFGANAIGEESCDGDAEQVVLVAGFESEAAAAAALAQVTERYTDVIGEATIAPAVTDWMVAQRAGLEPSQVGPWHIRAPWDLQRPNIDSSHDVVIDPGSAFGHGAHPSTVMAIELLIRHASDGGKVIDVGSGTGVIAIIAARLGLSVEAIEADVAAAEVASRNIEQNASYPHDGVNDLITLTVGDAADQPRPTPDTLVVANLTLDVQRLIAPVYSSATTLILSGLLCRQVREIAVLYPDHEARTIRTHGEWASLELVRPKQLRAGSRD